MGRERETLQPIALQHACVGLIAGLILAELMFIGLSYDASPLARGAEDLWFKWMAYGGYALNISLAMIAGLLLGIGPRIVTWWHALGYAYANHPSRYFLMVHGSVFLFLWWISDAVFSEAAQVQPPPSWMPIAWLAAVPAVAVTWALALAPHGFWRSLLITERSAVGLALVMAPGALVISTFAKSLWAPFSDMTLQLSAWMLSRIYGEVTVDYTQAILGGQEFVVTIGKECSGYEGIGLVTLFTAVYLSAYRNEFRFPNALVLFPLGITAIWIFNAVRIVALIIIGEEFSPEVAIGGFHSQAGWIMFIIVAVSILLCADRMPFLTAQPSNERKKQTIRKDVRLAIAMLTPLIVLLSTTLVTQAFSADHDWLYPLRVLATGAAITWGFIYARPVLAGPSNWLWPLAGGVIAFCMWLLLVPNDPEIDAKTSAILDASPSWLVAGWLAFRLIGAVVTVPVVEELVFRGYLLGRFSATDLSSPPRYSWMALLASSVVFGLLHDAWFAGFGAGLIYGLIRYHRGRLADAIAAHAVTNLLLSMYVLHTGAWSLW